MADYKPHDCLCPYPLKVSPTGSGHQRACPSHQRWENNGRSWRVKEGDSGASQLRFTAEARNIADELGDCLDRMQSGESDFIIGLADRFDSYGDNTFISVAQIDWLRKLKEKYL